MKINTPETDGPEGVEYVDTPFTDGKVKVDEVDISMTGMATETGGAKKTGESKGSEETPTNWTDTRLAIASPLFVDPLNMIALAWLVYTLYNLGNYLL